MIEKEFVDDGYELIFGFPRGRFRRRNPIFQIVRKWARVCVFGYSAFESGTCGMYGFFLSSLFFFGLLFWFDEGGLVWEGVEGVVCLFLQKGGRGGRGGWFFVRGEWGPLLVFEWIWFMSEICIWGWWQLRINLGFELWFWMNYCKCGLGVGFEVRFSHALSIFFSLCGIWSYMFKKGRMKETEFCCTFETLLTLPFLLHIPMYAFCFPLISSYIVLSKNAAGERNPRGNQF